MAHREQGQGRQGAGTWQAESRDKASIMKARGRQGAGIRQAESRHVAGKGKVPQKGNTQKK